MIVDRKSLEHFIKDHYQNIYSFSFALVPEELQARQMALDALELFMTKERDLMNEIVLSNLNDAPDLLSRLTVRYYKNVYELGVKRFDQLKGGLEIKVDRSVGSFYALGLNERAIIYLKMILKFDLGEIEQITEHTRYEILCILSSSREYLLRNNKQRSLPSPQFPGNSKNLSRDGDI